MFGLEKNMTSRSGIIWRNMAGEISNGYIIPTTIQ